MNPVLTDRMKLAIDKAAELHQSQHRKSSGLPYVTHLFGVAFILSKYTDDEDVVIAGLLHDVLEDVDATIYSAQNMERDFGQRVTGLVQDVSEDKIQKDYRGRKQAYLDHLKIASKEALLISAADLTHNILSFVQDFQEYGAEHVLSKFGGAKSPMFDFWADRIEVIEARLDGRIVEDLKAVYARAKNLLKK